MSTGLTQVARDTHAFNFEEELEINRAPDHWSTLELPDVVLQA